MRLRFDPRIILMIAILWLIYAFATGTGTDMRALFGGFGRHQVKAVVTQTTPELVEGEGVSGGAMLWWGFVIACSVAMLGGAIIVVGYALREFVVPSINDVRHAADPAYQAARTIRQSYKYGRKAGMTHAEADGLYGVNAAKADVWRGKREAVDATVETARARAALAQEKVDLLRQRMLPPAPALPEPAPEPIAPPLTLQQAIDQSTPRAWIVGQAGALQPMEGFREVGKLVTFDPRTTHVAIIGGTGSGKTASTGLLMALYARKFGLHPIILDGKEGIDWAPLDGIVEWHTMTPATIADQVAAIMDIFTERWEMLKATGAPNIYALSEPRPVPILLMMEEFGDIWNELKRTDAALWKEVAGQMDRLFRLARATGITLCLIDQAPEKWSQQMRGNAKFVTCYKLKGGVANAFNEYHVDRLPNVGVFSQDNIFYTAWHTQAEVDLAAMFAPLSLRLLDSYAQMQPAQPKPAQRRQPPSQQATPAEERRYVPAWEPPAPALPAKPQALTDAETLYVSERKWDAFAQAWCDAYPTRMALLQAAGQPFTPEDGRTPPTPADLAKAMADLHNARLPADPKHWKQNFYSQARRLFARYHSAGVPEAVEGVVEQIIRDEVKEAKVKEAKRAGAEVVYFNRNDLPKPKFLS